MNDRWLELAVRVQSIAQAGLYYAKDKYDIERYEQLREIAAEMLSLRSGIPVGRIGGFFCNETGYQTPKVDTRGAVFVDGKLLLVHENSGRWSLPGGWCDVDQSPASNTVKEVREEAGLTVSVQRLIAVQDWRKHNAVNYVHGVIKIFFMCSYESGEFEENIETTDIGFFARDKIPKELAVEKCTRAQIELCFAAHDDPTLPVYFD